MMSFSSIPNELLFDIAEYLPISSLSHLSRTSHNLSHLLTPLLLRLACSGDLARCIALDRPLSLRSILRSPTIDIDAEIQVIVMDRDKLDWPLNYAARHSTPEIVGILLSHGAIAIAHEPEGGPHRPTALECAVLSRSIDSVRLILDAVAGIDPQFDQNQCIAFDLACVNRDEAIAHFLIDRGTRLDANFLTYAASGGLSGVLTRLLDLGLPVDGRYVPSVLHQPPSALQYLCLEYPGNIPEQDMCAVAEVLLSRGADVNRSNDSDGAPLYIVMKTTNVALAKVLLRYGADVNGGPGRTSIVKLARERGCSEMVDLLVEHEGAPGLIL